MTDLTVSPGRDQLGRLTAHGRELLDRTISEVQRALLPHLDNTRADCRIDYTSHDCCHTCNLLEEVLDVAAEYDVTPGLAVASVILQAPVERTKVAQEAITRAFTEELDVSGLAKNHGAPIEYTVTKSEAPLVGRLFMKDIGTAQLVTGTMKECPSDEAIMAMLDAATPGPLEAQAIRASYENAPRLSMVLKYTPSSSRTEKMEIVAEKLKPDDAVLFAAAPMLIRVLLARAQAAERGAKSDRDDLAGVWGVLNAEPAYMTRAGSATAAVAAIIRHLKAEMSRVNNTPVPLAEYDLACAEVRRAQGQRDEARDEIVRLTVESLRDVENADPGDTHSHAVMRAADALGMSLLAVIEAQERALARRTPQTEEARSTTLAIATRNESMRMNERVAEVHADAVREFNVRSKITAYFDSLTDYDCAPDAESKAAARLAIGVALRALHSEAA